MLAALRRIGWLGMWMAASLPGAVVYSNLGPPDALYRTGPLDYFPVGVYTAGPNRVQGPWAAQFTIPAGRWRIDQLNVPVRNASGLANAVFVLALDNAGRPGTQFWGSGVLTGIPPLSDPCCVLTTVDITSGNPVLNSVTSTTYWLIVGPGHFANTDYWRTSAAVGRMASSIDGGASWDAGLYSNMGAFSLTGVDLDAPAPVPEPSTLLLVAAGLGLASLSARRRAKGALLPSVVYAHSDHGRRQLSHTAVAVRPDQPHRPS